MRKRIYLYLLTVSVVLSVSCGKDAPAESEKPDDFKITYHLEYDDGSGVQVMAGTDATAVSAYHYTNAENGQDNIQNTFEFENGTKSFWAVINLDNSGNPYPLGFHTKADTSNVLLAIKSGSSVPDGGKSVSGNISISDLKLYPLDNPIGEWKGFASLRYDIDAVLLLTDEDMPPNETGTLQGYVIIEPVF